MRHGFGIYIPIVLRSLGAIGSFLPIDRFLGELIMQCIASGPVGGSLARLPFGLVGWQTLEGSPSS
jgi:hypothetical protein